MGLGGVGFRVPGLVICIRGMGKGFDIDGPRGSVGGL